MILVELFMATILVAAWVFMFFVFDDLILKGYFQRKLQNRFKVEE